MPESTEKKIPWNARVFESIARQFDKLVRESYRGDKGTCMTAAALMFASVSEESRQSYIDIVKLAEGRGIDGTVLEAALAELHHRQATQQSELHGNPQADSSQHKTRRPRSKRKDSRQGKEKGHQ